jgi:Transposase
MSTTAVQAPDDVLEVVLGVDTHLDVHVAAVLDQLGRPLGELAVPTTKRGYHTLLAWAEGFGPVRCAGVEGTSSYGAGLSRHLKAAGIVVVEVQRPKRRHLRRNGKSDPIDAEAAAGGAGWPEARSAQQERRRSRGDDPGLESRQALGSESQNPGCQPTPGLTGEGPRGAPTPFARSLEKRTPQRGRSLPPD